MIKRGLTIDEPWIGHILEGQKDWEMRSQATSYREWFGLTRKGSGVVKPEYCDHLWKYDFVHCRTDDGKAFRTLNNPSTFARR